MYCLCRRQWTYYIFAFALRTMPALRTAPALRTMPALTIFALREVLPSLVAGALATLAFLVVLRVLIKLFFSMDMVWVRSCFKNFVIRRRLDEEHGSCQSTGITGGKCLR